MAVCTDLLIVLNGLINVGRRREIRCERTNWERLGIGVRRVLSRDLPLCRTSRRSRVLIPSDLHWTAHSARSCFRRCTSRSSGSQSSTCLRLSRTPSIPGLFIVPLRQSNPPPASSHLALGNRWPVGEAASHHLSVSASTHSTN